MALQTLCQFPCFLLFRVRLHARDRVAYGLGTTLHYRQYMFKAQVADSRVVFYYRNGTCQVSASGPTQPEGNRLLSYFEVRFKVE